MLPKQNLEKKLNVRIATSSVMDDAITLWSQMYKNAPMWLGGPEHVKSLNLPATIAEEMARLVLTEFDFNLEGSARADFLLDQMDTILSNLSNIVEMWCALGGVVFKPYAAGSNENGDPDHIEVDVVHADRFYPTAFNSNKEITGAVFVDTHRVGDYLYTRLEYHSLVGTHYTVVNKAYRSERIYTTATDDAQIKVDHPFMEEISLEQVEEWKGIKPLVELDGIEKPFFVYIKTPRTNTIDPHSPLGASVYARARDTIEEADKQYSRILWEYEATEAAIDADETLFTTDRKGNPILPKGKERLFRTYDIGGNVNEKTAFITNYSPEIRDDSLFNGLDKMYRIIEYQCGLAYGTLSESKGSAAAEQTAYEIRSSKQRSYTTVHAMQGAWETGLDELLYVMNGICDLYELVPDGEVKKTVTWGDGVLEDTETEYQRRWAMVISGKMKLEKFYAWYFGCTEEKALEYIPNHSEFPPEE